jgi:hypothetical protein
MFFYFRWIFRKQSKKRISEQHEFSSEMLVRKEMHTILHITAL